MHYPAPTTSASELSFATPSCLCYVSFGAVRESAVADKCQGELVLIWCLFGRGSAGTPVPNQLATLMASTTSSGTLVCIALDLLVSLWEVRVYRVKTCRTSEGPLGELASAGAIVSNLCNACVSRKTTRTHLASAGAIVSDLWENKPPSAQPRSPPRSLPRL